ncbi:hypothetical protein Hamer_G026905 [Homarus americanus]|uniref:Uncharacterized protein n=1 Tax=Homarus americanus TaxID=6706 RepID=A0A8J5MNY4_HOMAM|nr:hypothetical protein Hamer_G026905 [Homarus americanus]
MVIFGVASTSITKKSFASSSSTGGRPPHPCSSRLSPVSTNLRIISYAVVLGIRSSGAVSRKSSPASYRVIIHYDLRLTPGDIVCEA